MFKRQLTPPQQPMPEYQLFPIGFWHCIAAVMLMTLCIVCTTILITYLLGLDSKTRNLAFIELGIGCTQGVILAHLTFMVSRGSALSSTLLLWFNRACLTVLVFGNIVALIAGDYVIAMFASGGLVLALSTHQIYLSKRYRKFLDYYELIWAHNRWNRRRNNTY
ncbi:hypothetical protein [Nitrincola sp. MINF-07-Sa-05]|uniref:hypothetical protein n=1 Tax=Nitrincola salilacus TaxID=3400273 RepID=UPI00391843F7